MFSDAFDSALQGCEDRRDRRCPDWCHLGAGCFGTGPTQAGSLERFVGRRAARYLRFGDLVAQSDSLAAMLKRIGAYGCGEVAPMGATAESIAVLCLIDRRTCLVCSCS